jgi:hypothetical protein
VIYLPSLRFSVLSIIHLSVDITTPWGISHLLSEYDTTHVNTKPLDPYHIL